MRRNERKRTNNNAWKLLENYLICISSKLLTIFDDKDTPSCFYQATDSLKIGCGFYPPCSKQDRSNLDDKKKHAILLSSKIARWRQGRSWKTKTGSCVSESSQPLSSLSAVIVSCAFVASPSNIQNQSASTFGVLVMHALVLEKFMIICLFGNFLSSRLMGWRFISIAAATIAAAIAATVTSLHWTWRRRMTMLLWRC